MAPGIAGPFFRTFPPVSVLRVELIAGVVHDAFGGFSLSGPKLIRDHALVLEQGNRRAGERLDRELDSFRRRRIMPAFDGDRLPG
jgi:hypothetical protein